MLYRLVLTLVSAAAPRRPLLTYKPVACSLQLVARIRSAYVRALRATGYGLRAAQGFTVIELLVVTGIMIVVTGLVFANNSAFGGKVLLQNLAYDAALTVRQAQVYGISVQRYGEDTFAQGYGVHFFRNENPGVQDEFLLFADVIDLNGLYDCPEALTCELVAENVIRAGYRISDICVPASQAQPCGHTALDITFRRPDPDAFIRADGQATLYESARVILTSPRGETQSVIVEQNGQIAVQ